MFDLLARTGLPGFATFTRALEFAAVFLIQDLLDVSFRSPFTGHLARFSCFILPGEFQNLLLALEEVDFHSLGHMRNAFKALD